MRWRLYPTLLLAVLCLGVSIAGAQNAEDPEAPRRPPAAEPARHAEQMTRLDELAARLAAAHAEEEAAL